MGSWSSARRLAEAMGRIERELCELRALLQLPAPHLPIDVSQAVRHIHDRIMDPELSVSSLRRACGLTSNGFSARFRHAMGRRAPVSVGW